MMYLLPAPKRLVMTEGFFPMTQEMCIVLQAESGPLARTGARQLQEEIRTACGFQAEIRMGEASRGTFACPLSRANPRRAIG